MSETKVNRINGDAMSVETEEEARKIVKERVTDLIDGLRVTYATGTIENLLMVVETAEGAVVNNAGTFQFMRQAVEGLLASFIAEAIRIAEEEPGAPDGLLIMESSNLIRVVGQTMMKYSEKALAEGKMKTGKQASAVDMALRPVAMALTRAGVSLALRVPDGQKPVAPSHPVTGDA